ncbi:hypothetical protein OGAPHI_001115 [Ogataea philodendri]|uniref:Uncharacterized protein n=1 Tax=Ogataea philodendri TaxID=1378263 RepID=A0A9P8PFH6_9ASCO|nr:uncharacterized protein OGAPHI_001115 [Ogataea philodendri]KAH3670600.1 hypothetical protein OGAPHI_001115 [Ogataea philodendri]
MPSPIRTLIALKVVCTGVDFKQTTISEASSFTGASSGVWSSMGGIWYVGVVLGTTYSPSMVALDPADVDR